MTSTVESELKPGTSLVDLMSALFPCGSITGAPKIRTMEIIRELEPHTRGVYTGTIGFLRPGGDCMFNVAIRTVTIDSATGTALFGVGGGITIDSTAAKEYEECLVKSRFLQVEPVSFELFETMLLEDGEIFLLERHLVRLKDSANYFGFRFAESNFISALNGLKNLHRAGSWKVKLTLAKDGTFSTAISSLECGDLSPLWDSEPSDPLPEILLYQSGDRSPHSKERHWRVGLASRPVDPNDRFLFHKTTRRDFYLTELGARPDCDDLLFFNERGELTESSIANVVVELEGKLVTPPVSAGLLAGTFRAQLIEAGEIEERTITLAELQSITKIFLINSVRRWIQAEIICPKPNRSSRPLSL
jgi:para-aminobenzoate synthetase/4-amino-4-deoxychorismate lyase